MTATKIEQVPVEPAYTKILKSYTLINGEYQRVPTHWYKVEELQALKPEERLLDKIFGDEDFVIPPQYSGRTLVKAKVGKLFVEFQPGGKGSFRLTAYYINQHTKQMSTFLNLNMERYPEILFENILPLSLMAYYPATMVGNRNPNLPKFHCAYELKQLFTKLILGSDLTHDELRKFRENYYTLFLDTAMSIQSLENGKNAPASTPPLPQADSSENQSKRDVASFMANLELKPQSLFEVSTKIAAIFLTSLYISKEEINSVLREYAVAKGQDFATLAQKKDSLSNTILDTQIDKGRYPLKSLFDEDNLSMLQEAFDLPSKAAEVKPAASNNNNLSENANKAAEVKLSANNNPIGNLSKAAELDQMICAKVKERGFKDLKQQKMAYLDLLEQEFATTKVDRNEFASYLLDHPKHLLKEERSFFKFSDKFSNETASMRAALDILEQKPTNKWSISPSS